MQQPEVEHMRLDSLIKLSFRGISAVIFGSEKPLLGSVIITDKCNLSCLHCAVSNVTSVIYPHAQVLSDMQELYSAGARILLLYGGEPFLWKDGGLSLRDLVIEAKHMGFLLVNIVTNGTIAADFPEADLMLVSLDGVRENHNLIRGDTYDRIFQNIRKASSRNICLYMAINRMNKNDIESVCMTAADTPNVKAVSFNFHTPYPGTECLRLTRSEKHDCCDRIAHLIDSGSPILNLKSALPYIADNLIKTPCRQCMIMENGQRWICGRCSEIEGLCAECGYFFAFEFSLLFSGHFKTIWDFLKTYAAYL